MLKKYRPIIGITQPNKSINLNYFAIAICVFLAGGKPKMLTSKHPEPFANIDGLILGSGRDIWPAFFFEKIKKNYEYDFSRDSMEISYFSYAESRDIPILGICRGAQFINVIRGGTLHMSVRAIAPAFSEYPKNPLKQIYYRKVIFIKKDSLLHDILLSLQYRVNSLHSQAINKTGENLRVAAKDQNGIIQAIEDRTAKFILGVQFHPELLFYRSKIRRLFRKLIFFAYHRHLESRFDIG